MSSRHLLITTFILPFLRGVSITGSGRPCCQEAKSVKKQKAHLDAKIIQQMGHQALRLGSVHHCATRSLGGLPGCVKEWESPIDCTSSTIYVPQGYSKEEGWLWHSSKLKSAVAQAQIQTEVSAYPQLTSLDGLPGMNSSQWGVWGLSRSRCQKFSY